MELLKKRIGSQHISVQHSAIQEAKSNQNVLWDSLAESPYVASLALEHLSSIPKLILEIGKGVKIPLLLDRLIDLIENNEIQPHPLVTIYDQQKELLSLIISRLSQRKFRDSNWQLFRHILLSNDQISQLIVLNYFQQLQLQDLTTKTQLIVDTLTLNKPLVGDCVQEQILRFISRVELSEVLAHSLLARIAFCWIDQETICQSSLHILHNNRNEFSQLFYRNLLVISSLILLDFPCCLPLIDLVAIAADQVHDSATVNLAVLPLLTNLMIQETKDTKLLRNTLHQLLIKIENREYIAAPMQDTATPTMNIYYDAVSQLSLSFQHSTDSNFVYYFSQIPALKSLIYVSKLLQTNIDNVYSTMEAFNEHISSFRQKDMLKILSAYLYLVKKEKFVQYILAKSIPAMVKLNDPFVTNTSLQITLSFLKPQEFVSNLEFIGLEAITNIWKEQPRVWNHIKVYIANWAGRFKQSQGAGKVKTRDTIDKEDELEKVVCTAIFNFCLHNPQIIGADLLPVIISLLKTPNVRDFGKTRDLSEFGTGKVLSAFLVCIDAELSTTKAAWNVVFKRYFETLDESSYVTIYENVCKFFSIVAQKTDETEKSILFRAEILHNYLVPLLSHSNYDVRNYALLALEDFPEEDIAEHRVQPLGYLDEALKSGLADSYKNFIVKRIEYEVENMSRPVFKGISMEVGAKAMKRDLLSKKEDLRIDISMLEEISTEMYAVLQDTTDTILRQAFVNSILCFPPKQNTIEATFQLIETILNLITKEISISYSPLSFVEVLEGCTSFWQRQISFLMHLQKDEASLKEHLDGYAKSLITKIEQSLLPSSSSIMLMFLSGLSIALHQLEFLPTSVFTESVIEKLFQILTEKRFSSEVQSSTIISLTFIATYIQIMDYKLLEKIWHACLSDGAKFSFGFCAAKVLSVYVLSGSDEAKSFLDQFLLRFFDQSKGWISNGAAIGFAILLKDSQNVEEEYKDALLAVVDHAKKSLVATEQLDKAAVVSSCWILALGWRGYATEDQVKDIFAAVFEQYSNKDNEIESLLLAAQIRLQLLKSYSDTELNSLLQSTLNCLQNESENKKVAYSQALKLFIGKDYSFSGIVFHPILSPEDTINMHKNVYSILKSSPRSPKFVRSLGWLVGSCLTCIANAIGGTFSLASYQDDPVDYKRLNPEKSFLKSAYDKLVSAIKQRKDTESLELLDLLKKVNVSLPPVEWKVVLNYINGLPRGAIKCFQFTAQHASSNSAKSIVMRFLELFEKLATTANIDLLVSESGLGKLMQLGGFDNGITTISPNQIISILHILIPKLGEANHNSVLLYKRISDKLVAFKHKESNSFLVLEEVLIAVLVEMKDIVQSNYTVSIIGHIVSALGPVPSSRQKLLAVASTEYTLKYLWIVSFLLEFDSSLHSSYLEALKAVCTKPANQTSCSICVLYTFSKLRLNSEEKLKWLVRIFDLAIILNSDEAGNIWEYYWMYIILPAAFAVHENKVLDVCDNIDWPSIQSSGLISLKSIIGAPNAAVLLDRLNALTNKAESFDASAITTHLKYLLTQ
ncbi:hypothetical protein HDV01_006105 [Terramyces sp. JEL0728]|nr:hypothetical protein HDV01_006105 [Terramyces sp. JEL0728]